MTWYRLDGTTPVPCTIDEVAEWFEGPGRRVARTYVDVYGANVLVSTVFLAIDHSFGLGAPVLFETMVFWPNPTGHTLDHLQWRYRTWFEAKMGHQEVVNLVRQRILQRQRNGGGRTHRRQPRPSLYRSPDLVLGT